MTAFPTAVYPPTFLGAPGIVMVEAPPSARTSSLLVGRCTFMIFESEQELKIIERVREIWENTGAVRLCNNDTQRWAELPTTVKGLTSVLSYLYPPPAPGWPWVVIFAWPDLFVEIALKDDPLAFSRGRYTVEAFETEPRMLEYVAAFAARFSQDTGGTVTVRSAEDLNRATSATPN